MCKTFRKNSNGRHGKWNGKRNTNGTYIILTINPDDDTDFELSEDNDEDSCGEF